VINVSFVPDGNRYSGRLAVKSPPATLGRIKEIPGALYWKDGACWTIPAKRPAVLALGDIARYLRIPLQPDVAVGMWVAEDKARWSELLEQSAQREAVHVGGRLYSHQVQDALWLTEQAQIPGRLLLSEVGVGKTRAVLAALAADDLLEAGPVLVVCPNKVRWGWQSEIAEYLGPGARAVVVGGTLMQRRKQLAEVGPGDIVIIGWEAMRTHTRLRAFPGHALKKCEKCGGPKLSEEGSVKPAQCQAHEKELNAIPWSVIVADEIHRIRNAKTVNAQALWGLSAARPEARRWGLSGTLVSRTPDDCWSPLHWLDPVAWPVKSSWVDWYCRKGFDNAGFERVLGLKQEREQEFQATFQAITRRVLKADVLNLPEIQRGGSLVRTVAMGKAQEKAYVEMRDQMVAWLRQPDGSVDRLTAQNIMIKTGRLMMLAQAHGSVITSVVPGQETPRVTINLAMPSCKVDAVVDDIASGDFGDSQCIVFFESKKLLRLTEDVLRTRMGTNWNEIAVIAGGLPDHEIKRAMEMFQSGKRQYIFCTFGAAAEGITLTAADTILMVQRSWSSPTMTQAMARFHRPGAEKHSSLSVVDYFTEGTVEFSQLERLDQNETAIEQVIRDKDRQGLIDLILGKER